MKALDIYSDSSLNLHLTWQEDYEYSISVSQNSPRHILMTKESIPEFVYFLAKSLDNYDFLSKSFKKKIYRQEKVYGLKKSPEHFIQLVEDDFQSLRRVYYGTYLKDGIEKKIDDTTMLNILRSAENLGVVIDNFRSKDINYKTLDYIGNLESNFNMFGKIHVFKKNDIYLVQGIEDFLDDLEEAKSDSYRDQEETKEYTPEMMKALEDDAKTKSCETEELLPFNSTSFEEEIHYSANIVKVSQSQCENIILNIIKNYDIVFYSTLKVLLDN